MDHLRDAFPHRRGGCSELSATGLDRGESEAIALAVERRADRLLVDERHGRLAAEGMGVAVIGTVGVPIAAKARGEIDAVLPLLESVRASGLWISDALVTRVLAVVDEHPGR